MVQLTDVSFRVPGDATAPRARDPRVAMFLGVLKAGGWPSLAQRTPRQARHDLRILHAATGSWRPVRDVGDALVAGPEGSIPVRVYRPGRAATNDRALIVYFHGGGFVIGDLFTADGICRRLANAAGATVVSVHYRRAPEHRLPAAQVDAYAATCWALRHARELGADSSRLVVAGDSAGGGLAAHVAQRLRDEGPAGAALQLLINPGLDFTLEHTDRDPELAQLLDWETIDWFAEHALPESVDRADPVLSPARAPELGGLPPAVVITAGIDPFRADAEHYARALEAAGVPVAVHQFTGQIHGFMDMDLLFPAAKRALQRLASAVRDLTPREDAVDASDEPIAWTRPARGRLRRMREHAQRLPLVNGPDALWNLLAAHLQSAATRHRCTATEGGTR
jgi:acetyl esterase